MNEELSHVAQWLELERRARNFGFLAEIDKDGFILTVGRVGFPCYSLAELRAAISDRVAYERTNGLRKN